MQLNADFACLLQANFIIQPSPYLALSICETYFYTAIYFERDHALRSTNKKQVEVCISKRSKLSTTHLHHLQTSANNYAE
jgi:hypothetical protein